MKGCNVWWSVANEFDFMMNENRPEVVELKKRGLPVKIKTLEDWDRFFQILQQEDAYQHLRSIHNGFTLYNHTKPWVTHASIQNGSAVTQLSPLAPAIGQNVYFSRIARPEIR